jgi:hypothetical protein
MAASNNSKVSRYGADTPIPNLTSIVVRPRHDGQVILVEGRNSGIRGRHVLVYIYMLVWFAGIFPSSFKQVSLFHNINAGWVTLACCLSANKGCPGHQYLGFLAGVWRPSNSSQQSAVSWLDTTPVVYATWEGPRDGYSLTVKCASSEGEVKPASCQALVIRNKEIDVPVLCSFNLAYRTSLQLLVYANFTSSILLARPQVCSHCLYYRVT